MQENALQPHACQEKMLRYLLQQGKRTAFGNEHRFNAIRNYDDFRNNIPVSRYTDVLPYIERVLLHEKNVLWPGLPSYFGKTSGTTGGAKYLPVTSAFINATQNAAKYMIANLFARSPRLSFKGSVLHISDPHVFENKNGFLAASVSAIKSHNKPWWVKPFSLPGDNISAITDPAIRMSQLVHRVKNKNIAAIVGLPVWIIHFLEAYERQGGNKLHTLLPGIQALFVTGMNHEPYRHLLRKYLGDDFILLENYTATEGNFAYQDDPQQRGMQLICNQGIFYEFILLHEVNTPHPNRYALHEIRPGEKYAMLISTNAGLWAYQMTDIVEFVSVNPYKLVIKGRLGDIFSPFGEHMLTSEAEEAIATACDKTKSMVKDFVVIPVIAEGTRKHRWYIEFRSEYNDKAAFAAAIDTVLKAANVNYKDLSDTRALSLPEVHICRHGFFDDLHKAEQHYSSQSKTSHFKTGRRWEKILNELNLP